jgi:hypothetical protein
MSRSWDRRSKRRNAPHGRNKHAEPALRVCCWTPSRRRHAANCRRDPVMCGVKTGFETATNAESHALELVSITAIPWRVYHCPWCGLYHLTSKGADG